MNYKAVLFYLGLFIYPLAALSFLNILYSTYFDYFLNIETYTLTFFLTLITASLLWFFGKNSEKKLNFYDQILLIILVYLFTSIFISLPYYFSNYQITFIDSLFESFSGVTSTGFSIFENIKYLDPTLILWRSSSQWIGGLYFLIFLIIIFSNNQYNFKLNHLVYTGNMGSFSKSNIKSSLFQIFLVYSLLTLLIFVILNIGSVRLFNSLNLSMSIISNGGFLPANSLNQIFLKASEKDIKYLMLDFIPNNKNRVAEQFLHSYGFCKLADGKHETSVENEIANYPSEGDLYLVYIQDMKIPNLEIF